MKVGTDAVVLGAWVNVAHASRILEIGTGSGVIALMLAQRSAHAAHIDAIEIAEEDAAQARQNVERSPWAGKIKVLHVPIQDFRAAPYDLIVCNPPFFSDSLLPPSEKRKQARHTGLLTQEELIENSMRLMTDAGRLAVILPVKEGERFKSLARRNQLKLHRALTFFSRKGKPQERWLFEFSTLPGEAKIESLTLHEGLDWSPAYKELTKDFYLLL